MWAMMEKFRMCFIAQKSEKSGYPHRSKAASVPDFYLSQNLNDGGDAPFAHLAFSVALSGILSARMAGPELRWTRMGTDLPACASFTSCWKCAKNNTSTLLNITMT